MSKEQENACRQAICQLKIDKQRGRQLFKQFKNFRRFAFQIIIRVDSEQFVSKYCTTYICPTLFTLKKKSIHNKSNSYRHQWILQHDKHSYEISMKLAARQPQLGEISEMRSETIEGNLYHNLLERKKMGL